MEKLRRQDADERHIAFEIHGLILALHYEARFLKTPGSTHRAHRGFDHILARYGSAAEPASHDISHAVSTTKTSAKPARSGASRPLKSSKPNQS